MPESPVSEDDLKQVREKLAEIKPQSERVHPSGKKIAALRDECCRNCRFWDDHSCLRFPPVVSGNSSFWPNTDHTEWCGEWKSR